MEETVSTDFSYTLMLNSDGPGLEMEGEWQDTGEEREDVLLHIPSKYTVLSQHSSLHSQHKKLLCKTEISL